MNNLNIFFFKITKRLLLKFINLISLEHDTKYFGTPYGGWDFVEFDELTVNFIKPYFKASNVNLKLLFNGYVLISTDNFPNFLFAKKDFIKSRAK